MSKATEDLIIKAKELDNGQLTDAIEALEFLGEDATANHQEFKDLKDMVKAVQNGDAVEGAVNEQDTKQTDVQAPQEPQTAKQDTDEGQGDKQVAESLGDAVEMGKEPIKSKAPEVVPTEDASPKLSYDGIKMIGNQFFSKKDGYKKPFSSADDCARHFNK